MYAAVVLDGLLDQRLNAFAISMWLKKTWRVVKLITVLYHAYRTVFYSDALTVVLLCGIFFSPRVLPSTALDGGSSMRWFVENSEPLLPIVFCLLFITGWVVALILGILYLRTKGDISSAKLHIQDQQIIVRLFKVHGEAVPEYVAVISNPRLPFHLVIDFAHLQKRLVCLEPSPWVMHEESLHAHEITQKTLLRFQNFIGRTPIT